MKALHHPATRRMTPRPAAAGSAKAATIASAAAISSGVGRRPRPPGRSATGGSASCRRSRGVGRPSIRPKSRRGRRNRCRPVEDRHLVRVAGDEDRTDPGHELGPPRRKEKPGRRDEVVRPDHQRAERARQRGARDRAGLENTIGVSTIAQRASVGGASQCWSAVSACSSASGPSTFGRRIASARTAQAIRRSSVPAGVSSGLIRTTRRGPPAV